MHTLPLFYPTPRMPSPYSIPPHGCPPPILSQPMHTLPLLYLTPCIPFPYSIPAHTHPPPILLQPMYTLPLFYPSPCMPSPNSRPAHAHPLPILSQPTHATPAFYSIPAHACPNSLSHTPWRHVSNLTYMHMPLFNLLTSAHIEYIIIMICLVCQFANLEYHFITLRHLNVFLFFFFSGGKWRDLAMVTKNHHYICSWPLFRPHDSPVRGIKVTEPDLNSPWELPKSGSYSTPALESPVGFLLY